MFRIFHSVVPLWAFWVVGATTLAPTFQTAICAQEVVDTASLTRREVTGAWHSARGNRYTFRSNGTYTFVTGARGSGNISHSGTWKLANHGRLLRLHWTSRVVLEGRRRRALRADKRFSFVIGTQDPQAGFLLGPEEFRPVSEKF